MEWIKTTNRMFLQSEVIALEYSPGSDQIIATLLVHLSNGSQIKLIQEETVRVWDIFNEKL